MTGRRLSTWVPAGLCIGLGAGLIATAQKVEHYEIASYGSARDWAEQLGLPEHAQMLEQTLIEEKHADKLLTEISHTANATAAV